MQISPKPKKVLLRKVTECDTIHLPDHRQVDLGVQKFLDAFWRAIFEAFAPKPPKD